MNFFSSRSPACALRVASVLLALVLSPLLSRAAGVGLQPFNVDISQTSVSGLSSGGYMAVQLEVAYSSIVKGVGVIAAGPYFCAQGRTDIATTVCSCTALLPTLCKAGSNARDVPALIKITDQYALDGKIETTSSLASHKIFLFSGIRDTKVPRRVMNDLETYYKNYTNGANIRYVKNRRAGHGMPTDSFGNASCAAEQDPFINKCGYAAAGELLKWIYGSLNPRNMRNLDETNFVQFDQTEFDALASGMDTTGWLYVPAQCRNGEPCKLHVVFHGCRQSQNFSPIAFGFGPIGPLYGTTFVKNAGYNEWADNNNIIVLYPQALASFVNAKNPSKPNPLGCWDWWGYDDDLFATSPQKLSYATKAGSQIAAVKKMIDRIAGGHR